MFISLSCSLSIWYTHINIYTHIKRKNILYIYIYITDGSISSIVAIITWQSNKLLLISEPNDDQFQQWRSDNKYLDSLHLFLMECLVSMRNKNHFNRCMVKLRVCSAGIQLFLAWQNKNLIGQNWIGQFYESSDHGPDQFWRCDIVPYILPVSGMYPRLRQGSIHPPLVRTMAADVVALQEAKT